MEEKNRKQLPQSITLDDEYDKLQKAWMAALGNAQRAYDALLADPDIGEHLPSFNELDSAWIKSFVDSKIDAVMQSPNTYNARIEAVNEWKQLENDLLAKVKNIEVLRSIDPDLKIEVKGSHIIISNMEDILRTRTEFEVPESFKTFYAVALECADHLQRLHEIQKTWGISIPPTANSVAVQLAQEPEQFIKFCINLQKRQEWELSQQKPSVFDAAIKEHEAEVKRLDAERQKRFEEAREEKIRNGEQVDFGVSVRTIEGRLIPVESQNK